ncbi:MAG: 3-hydroxyacyl-CoA dehydrogenase/enoyl-CoA hydratase family protein [Treponema sp.]|nr:3-hydroxyacyl-CoA dehydrogenase/enoyl-CoA hydratase family protein [Treponema sp.]
MKYHIKKAAVIGSGVMGAGIAALIADTGIPVVLLDMVPKELSAEEKARGIGAEDSAHLNRLALSAIDRLLADKKTPALFLPSMAGYITAGNLETSLESIRDCDWIVEVVAENLDIKRGLFRKLEPYINETAIVSTNTSGLPVSLIAEEMPPDLQRRFLGTHFFNPPRYMRLLEIIPTAKTGEGVLDFMRDFARDFLGKGVVIAKDTPNFIGNRIGSIAVPYTWKAMEKFGFDVEKADSLTGDLIGRPRSATFRTVDMVGIDVLSHVNDNLAELLEDPAEKAIFALPAVIRDMLKAGRLGDKTGGGFYKRSEDAEGKRQKLVWDYKKGEYVPVKKERSAFLEKVKENKRLGERLRALVYSEEPEGRFVWEITRDILIYAALKMPEIARNYEDIDNALKWGYNWDVGPFGIWDLIGFEEAAARMKAEGFTLPDWIEERLKKGQKFYEADPDPASPDSPYPVIRENEHSVILDLGDGVAGFEFRSPGSALTAQLRKELPEAIDEVERNNDYAGLVLLNNRKNFATGADLKEMVTAIFMGQFDGVEDRIKEFQNVSMRLKYAKKPVVAAIHGMVLGGGCEWSMHCSRVVAHIDSYVGLVEVGVGLLPSGGGLKELLQRGMEHIGVYDYKDVVPLLQKYLTQVAAAKVAMNAWEAREMNYLRPTDKIVMQYDHLIPKAKEEVLLLAREGYRQQLPVMTTVSGFTGLAAVKVVLMGMVEGGFATEYDGVIAEKIGRVLTGGDLPANTQVSEEELLTLEREGFMELMMNAKTQERIAGMAGTGRPVRN